MKADARRIAAALDKPGEVRLFLLHGPDEAGSIALAARLAQVMGADAERVDLDGAVLKADPARLADEAASLSLFGGARFIRIGHVGEESLAAIEALLTAERAGNPVVAIAPGLKSTARLVKLAIESPLALAFASYAPGPAEAGRLVAGIARDHGLRISPAAAERLVEASGGDRAVMTREIEKLALFLDADADRPADLDLPAIEAVGADLGESDTAQAVAALLDGDPSTLGAELTRLTMGGASAIAWLRQLVRRLLTLAEMRAAVDAGDSIDTAMKRHRVFFREEEATARALRRWSAAMLATAIDQVRQAERSTMAASNAGDVLANQAALSLARRVARR